MMEIWKAKLEMVGEQTVRVPAGAKALVVQLQKDVPCLWFSCEPDNDMSLMTVWMRGTGHPHDGSGEYVGTIQLNGGSHVFHFFAAEGPSNPNPAEINLGVGAAR